MRRTTIGMILIIAGIIFTAFAIYKISADLAIGNKYKNQVPRATSRFDGKPGCIDMNADRNIIDTAQPCTKEVKQ